ncbi:MAG: AlpA family phage regulatory protein [Lysobacterales bacterium]
MRNRFIRGAELYSSSGIGQRETVRKLEKAGLFPPRIMLSSRCAAWLEHEVDRRNAAVAAGCTDDELRELIRRMVAERQQARTA